MYVNVQSHHRAMYINAQSLQNHVYQCVASAQVHVLASIYTAREASWRRAFDPCTPVLFELYHYLEQNGYFRLVPEIPILSEPGSILIDGFDTRLIP